MKDAMLLMAVGDTFLDCEYPDQAFGPALKALSKADLLFGNSEGVYSNSAERLPTGGWSIYAEPAKARPLKGAGFHVMSVANNHAMDLGASGLTENASVLSVLGIESVGAGPDRAAAHRAVVRDVGGVRVGFLARTSVFPPGFQARENSAGVAGLRVHSHYYIPDWDPYGYIEPGVRPSVRTVPFPEDLEELQAAIRALRMVVDIVVCSFHWGLAGERGTLTDYERIVGHAAVDGGADLVLGHHHHYLRGVEIYKGKPIYYGLGHFAFSNDRLLASVTQEQSALMRERFGDYVLYPREGYPTLPFHPDGRLTFIVHCDITRSGCTAPGFVPCVINPLGQPVPVTPSSPEGARVIDYVRDISQIGRLLTGYTIVEHPVLGEVIGVASAY